MSLTERQRQVLDHLRRLYRRVRRAVPYAELADSLGVSKWSAYDMMQTLEQKGMVRREYVLRGGRSRSGRSRVAFRPASPVRPSVGAGDAGLARSVGEWERAEWRRTRRRLLRELERPHEGSLLERLLTTIPRQRARLAYCAQLLTALLLRLRTCRPQMDHAALLRSVSERVSRPHAKLMVLAGLAGGLSLQAEDDTGMSDRLALYLRRYERYVREMSASHRRTLLRFFREVVRRLSPDPV